MGTVRLMRVEWYEFAFLLGRHIPLKEVKKTLAAYHRRNFPYSRDVEYVHVMGETHGLTGTSGELGLDPTGVFKLKYNPSRKTLSVSGFVSPVASHHRASKAYAQYYHDDDTLSTK